MAESRPKLRFKIAAKINIALVPLLAACLVVGMIGLEEYLRVFFQARAELEATRLAQTVELALRQTMLKKPGLALDATLADVRKTPDILRLWVIDKEGRLAHADDPALVGKMIDRSHNSVSQIFHAASRVPQATSVFTVDDSGNQVLRHVRPIANEKPCWGCHDSSARLNGILLVHQSTQPFQTALWTIQRRLTGTGVITVLLLAFIVVLVTTVLVQRPVARLIAEVRKVGTGDLSARVPVEGNDE